jgi:hypothetical protein
VSGAPRLADVARARLADEDEGRARAREGLDRVASELGELLALDLPPAVRLRVVVALRAVAGAEALAEAPPEDPVARRLSG